ncbi:unnamed protein product [Paramecium octaurelia]|uniref:Uncharacterized protein n=1 Tax=Paramecium octaurelia TaxID=43137 RepID=A0A8S1VMY1_PAROT|nr:unnamed protein product [Paramecium octaurelia]
MVHTIASQFNKYEYFMENAIKSNNFKSKTVIQVQEYVRINQLRMSLINSQNGSGLNLGQLTVNNLRKEYVKMKV